jgi:hypothetical protein
MSPTSRISRRRFVASAIYFSGGIGFALMRPWRVLISISRPTLPGRIVALFDHRDSARALGRAFLARAPTDAAAGELVDRIATRVPRGRSTLEGADDRELRALLADAVTADFEALRVVDVDGWILSATEADLYALAATALEPRHEATVGPR